LATSDWRTPIAQFLTDTLKNHAIFTIVLKYDCNAEDALPLLRQAFLVLC